MSENMATKQERIEIDTSLPFESVRAAVSLFGEKVDLKKSKPPEKRTELILARDELLKVREQLALTERAKEKALEELEMTKKQLEYTTYKVKNIDGMTAQDGADYIRKGDQIEQSLGEVEEKHIVWETQRESSSVNQATVSADLESARQELAHLTEELLGSVKEKDAILKQTEEALNAVDVNTKMAEDLNKEVAGLNESLVLLKLACIEANRDKIALLEAKGGDKGLAMRDSNDSALAKKELERESHLEKELAAIMTELRMLQTDIASAKDSEIKALNANKEASATLETLRLDIERTKMSEESASSSLQSLSTQLEEAKDALKKRLDNAASLAAVLESLRAEAELTKRELTSVKAREGNATAAASVLTGELTKMKTELAATVAAEAKAVESISGLSQAFEQVKAEAAEAKGEAEALGEAALKARADAEQAEAANQNAEKALQTALEEAEAAKVAESAAVAQLRSLSLKTNESRASEVEAGAGITISKDEYDSLQRKVQEAEELANMRVAAAIAQVEAVRASEQEILRKVAMASEDMENLKTSTKQALQRAEMAEAAKSAVENELKRLREREQMRREKYMTVKSGKLSFGSGDGMLSTSAARAPLVESSMNSVNMSLADEETATFNRPAAQKKKKPFLDSLGSYLSMRKSSSNKLS